MDQEETGTAAHLGISAMSVAWLICSTQASDIEPCLQNPSAMGLRGGVGCSHRKCVRSRGARNQEPEDEGAVSVCIILASGFPLLPAFLGEGCEISGEPLENPPT